MTKKHFTTIAAIVKDNHHEDIPYALADYFQTINANFDRARFIEACDREPN